MTKRNGFQRSRFSIFALLFFILIGIFGNGPSAYALDDGLAKTPPMGWNSWNKFGCNINENLILDTAKSMIASGMKDAGYEYVNIDDCWMSAQRDATGHYVADPVRFPHGIKWLADQIHDMGLKIGVYSSNGAKTCQGLPGGYGHEKEDAEKYAEWGIDYLKYDWCYSPQLNYSADIDKITVANNVHEAESPSNTISGGASISNCNTCSAGKKVGNIGNNQGSLVFNGIQAPQSGSYDLSISYLNSYGENNIPSRSALVSVNDGEAQKVNFVNTGGWDKVGTTTISVNLQAGENTIKFYNPWTKQDNAQYVYSNMHNALTKAYEGTGRSIVFSLCEWGSNDPWLWGKDVGHLWRSTGDISDNWASAMSILDQQVGLEKYAGPGHWNDPDMLEVGNGGMTNTEYKAHFSLWSILAAPLIAGNDLRSMSEETKEILLNKEVIAIDQDSLGIQGSKISDNGDQEIWAKPLANGDRAVVLLNRGNSAATISVNAEEIGMPKASSYVQRNLWTHTETVSAENIIASVPSHGAAMFRVKSGTPNMGVPTTTFSFEGDKYTKPGETTTLTSTFTNHGRIAIQDIHLQVQYPEGWTVKPASETDFNNLPPAKSIQVKWLVTPPSNAKEGYVSLNANASYVHGGMDSAEVSTDVIMRIPPPAPQSDSYLSDLSWINATNGWGPVERDTSNGESQLNDGKTITIGGVQYTKGLGTHAQSEVTYYLGGKFSAFTTDVGLDDEVGDRGSVVFQVLGDGKILYDSGLVTGTDSAKKANVDISGVNELKLVVTNGGDDINYDHADWANAFIAK